MYSAQMPVRGTYLDHLINRPQIIISYNKAGYARERERERGREGERGMGGEKGKNVN